MIDEEECRSRIRHAQENDICNFYMLTLDKVQQQFHCIDLFKYFGVFCILPINKLLLLSNNTNNNNNNK